jgi:amino acid adenylation domain-containing protein
MSGISRDAFLISPKKRALIEAMLRKEGVVSAAADQIPCRGDRGPAPLSFAQQRLWFFDQFEPGSPVYNLTAPIAFEGNLDIAALERAFNFIVQRHEALRTTFDFRDGQPVQIIAPAQTIGMRFIDLSHLQHDEQQAKIEAILQEESTRPFDLKQGPLLRTTLLRVHDTKHVLLFAVHHIVSDAWSTGLLIHELGELYSAFVAGRAPNLPELPIQYSDFAVWQRQWLQGAVLNEQLTYWKKQLGNNLPVLELPADRPRPPLQTFQGSTIPFSLPPTLSKALRALSQSERATLFMTLLTAFKVLLHRYTGLEDITVGTPIANRQRQDLEHLIGFFTNTLAIRTDLSGNPAFCDLLRMVRETLLDAYAHQDLPFEYLVEELHPERTLSHSPLVQILFVMKHTEPDLDLPGLLVTPLHNDFGSAKFDLTCYMDDRGDHIGGAIEYNVNLFAPQTIERLAGHFQQLFASIVNNPAERISDLQLLTGAEKQQLLSQWNQTQAAYPQVCAHQLFEEQVTRTPDAVCVTFGENHLTYRELDASANKLAEYLCSLGVVPGAIVGIFMERSPEMIVAILGILKVGAACLPLNPSYPYGRLAFMLKDSEASGVITQCGLAARLPQTEAPRIFLDDELKTAMLQTNGAVSVAVAPEAAAYVIYTSGSTGEPKGVVMPHRALVNLAHWHRATASHSARVLQFASLTFDVSFQEIFSTMAAGGTLVLLPDATRIDIAELGRFIQQNQIERFHLPVVVLQKLAEQFCENPAPLSCVREFMVGGEQLQITPDVIRLFDQLSECTLYNHYGPSETHVMTSFPLRLPASAWPALPPLGRPLANTRVYVLDGHLQPVPVGVSGELYIGGDCVAHGYLRRPGLTAERFIPDPFGGRTGARIYKTGDLVRYLRDGNLEFLGRNDFQVKVRGMRIELGEIEVALRAHPLVREAVVIVRTEERNEKTLAAYIVPQSDPVTAKDLRGFLKERLPEHMVPAYFVILQEFPLTSSGKINRLALPAPGEDAGAASDYVIPETAVEQVLAGIFAEVLGLARISALDNFFDLGGHSLMATQVASRIREAFRSNLPVRAIFEEPTIRGLARSILESPGDRRRIERTAELLLELQVPTDKHEESSIEFVECIGGAAAIPEKLRLIKPKETPLQAPTRVAKTLKTAPLSFAQQRLWFLDQFETQSILYNLPAALRLKGRLNIDALGASLNQIVRRHESLRTTFGIAEDRPVQLVHEPGTWKLTVNDLRQFHGDEREEIAARLMREEAEAPFDLTKGPLLRTQLLRLSEDDHILLLTMHHIVSDGWSVQVFIRELAFFYGGFCEGAKPELADLSWQYTNFSTWQRQWLQGKVLAEQLGYWKQKLAGIPPVLELPLDRPRPPFKTFNGATVAFHVPKKLAQQVVQLGRREGTTLFMTLLSAFYVFLYRYTGQEDLVVGAPIANRNRREIEDLIGFFVNTLVMRTQLSRDLTFRELLAKVREVSLEAYAHQDVPFEKLVEELQPERNLSHSPLFQVVFHLQNALTKELCLAGLSISAIKSEAKQAKYDLVLSAFEAEDELKAVLNYNTDLFEAETIARMARHMQTLLQAAAEAPDQEISRLELLTAEEERQLLFTWNDCKRDYGKNRLVHHAVEEYARLTPDKIAVRSGNATLTYGELNRRANQLAHYLRKLGVGPEAIVGICSDRNVEMMIALLGILKSGGAYLALDPSYPKTRLAFMLDEAQVKVLVTQEALSSQLPESSVQRICLDSDAEELSHESEQNPASGAAPENLAYVIYTSGSTGKPKGIMIEHGSLANYVAWANELMLDDTVKSVPAVQALTFDGSLKQIFSPLLRGIEVRIMEKTEVADPAALLQALKGQKNVRFSAVPSMWKAVLDAMEADPSVPRDLIARAFVGGEELPKSLVDRTFALLPELLLWNFYGPSEITATAAAALVHTGDRITIGRPIAGKKIHILDSQLRPVPIGVAGEIYVGHEGVARGYLQRADLTAESFVPDPFSPDLGARLYRTRDTGRYLADGAIEFLGRHDHQVKVRGFRIELGEIEAALRDHHGLSDAVALIRKGADDEKYIAAYVVPAQQPAPTAGELRAWLKDRLPEYMVPSAWIHLEHMPLTASGKLDRASLPEPERGRPDLVSHFVAPRTAIEEMLAEIFSDILGLEHAGVDDNFFELGGHSLLATRVVARIRKVFSADLPLRRFFERPTVREIAQFLTANETRPGQMEEAIALLRKIENLSADDLEQLLRKKKAKGG